MLKSRLYQKLLKIDMGKICRFCMKEAGSMKEIKGKKISNMIFNCSSVQISESNRLPNKICNTCFRLLTLLYNFNRKILQVERMLQDFIKHQHYYNECQKRDIINIALDEADIHTNLVDSVSLVTKDNIAPSLPKHSEPILENLDLELLNYELNKDVLSYELPPLVPLGSNESNLDKNSINLNCKTVEGITHSALPPLVPIKPSVDLKLLQTVMESPNLKFNCSLCNQEFISILELRNHKLERCKSQNTLECNICQKQFKESKKLINHLKGHKMTRDHECKICGKRYPNPSTFKVHFRTHTGERPYKCQLCNKGFVRWAGVINHMKTHEAQKPFKCETCGKTFKIQSNLERHKLLHSGRYPYCCSFCGKTFNQSDHLKVHTRTYHTNERPFLCNECGKGFVSSSRLKRHMWVHSGYKPYACQQCPKSYSNSIDLKIHKRAHGAKTEEGKKYCCHQCNMKFYHPCRLHRHMKTHEKQCSYCGKYFRNISFLNNHMKNIHNNVSEEA